MSGRGGMLWFFDKFVDIEKNMQPTCSDEQSGLSGLC